MWMPCKEKKKTMKLINSCVGDCTKLLSMRLSRLIQHQIEGSLKELAEVCNTRSNIKFGSVKDWCQG